MGPNQTPEKRLVGAQSTLLVSFISPRSRHFISPPWREHQSALIGYRTQGTWRNSQIALLAPVLLFSSMRTSARCVRTGTQCENSNDHANIDTYIETRQATTMRTATGIHHTKNWNVGNGANGLVVAIQL